MAKGARGAKGGVEWSREGWSGQGRCGVVKGGGAGGWAYACACVCDGAGVSSEARRPKTMGDHVATRQRVGGGGAAARGEDSSDGDDCAWRGCTWAVGRVRWVGGKVGALVRLCAYTTPCNAVSPVRASLGSSSASLTKHALAAVIIPP